MRDSRFYQEHLDRVSRSFAFCIERLEPPLRGWVSLSYLLCRVLDTVEDALWPDPALQAGQFREFLGFLETAPAAASVFAWGQRFPATISLGERSLLGDFGTLLEDLHGLPEEIRRTISGPVRRMALGMREFAKTPTRLASIEEVNRYCFVVAGLVGGLLSRLYLAFRPSFDAPSDFQVNGCHFGLFLQKVNLLKDQSGDEKEGRHLVPDRALVLESLRKNACGALDYLVSLPLAERGYRLFCGWSLFIGLASLPWIEESYAKGDASIKIPRTSTLELMSRAEAAIGSNEKTRELYEELENHLSSVVRTAARVRRPSSVRAPDVSPPGLSPLPPPWFLDLASDDFRAPGDLSALGLAP